MRKQLSPWFSVWTRPRETVRAILDKEIRIISLYLGSFLLKSAGRFIGGSGSYGDLRIAITRGVNVPVIMIGTLWLPQFLLFGGEIFKTEMPRIC